MNKIYEMAKKTALLWIKGESPRSSSKRSQAKTMNDEDIARLTIPELTELIRRLLEEIEVRAMELS